jgi:cytochrome P450
LTDDDIVAQALMFFVAGFETSSSTLSYAMLEMARLPTVQQSARENIKDVLKRHNCTMNYQALQEMHYLDWIIDGAPLPQTNHFVVFLFIYIFRGSQDVSSHPYVEQDDDQKLHDL